MTDEPQTVADDATAVSLTAFLREQRARFRPEDAGFVRDARRRVPGLRREELAELLGVSDVWYIRCETGRARLSLATLNRLASVLKLDRDDKARLFELARPELAGATARASTDSLHAVGDRLAEFRRLAKIITACSTSAELGEAVTRATVQLIDGPGLAYWEATADDGTLHFDAVEGHRADLLHNYVQPAGSIVHLEDVIANGKPFGEADLSISPSPEMRARIELIGTHSYFGAPVQDDDGKSRFLFGFAKLERYEPTPLEVHTLGLIAAMVELVVAGK